MGKGTRFALLALVVGARLWAAVAPQSKIEHLVVVVQENHSFDSYFGRFCQAPTGSRPSCNEGAACCEAAPLKDPGTGRDALLLTEEMHQKHDPDHSRHCMVDEINGGKMDRYVVGECGNPRNFAFADESVAGPYWRFARQYAMGDQVFQSVAGASAANNMYYAQARWAFDDNELYPVAKGANCQEGIPQKQFENPHIGDLLSAAGVSWSAFAEDYQRVADASPQCLGVYPHAYDPADIPFSYFKSSADNPAVIRDFSQFGKMVQGGQLPAVSFVKALGIRQEHPGAGIKMKDGMDFVTGVYDTLMASPIYSANTLLIVTPDESGGYFDHVPPPPNSSVDGQPYGPRIYLLALGHFARTGGYISHVRMEHSSLLRFIEWNWLGGKTGQLGARDAVVNGIGSLLDPAKTGVPVP